MSTTKLGGLLLIAAAIWAGWQQYQSSQPEPTPEPTPAPAGWQQELATGFAGEPQAALTWSGMLHGLANFIEADGKTSKPVLTTMLDINQLREAAIAAALKPVPGGDRIGKALGPQLEALGKGGEKLSDSDRRSKAVAIFRGAAQALEGT